MARCRCGLASFALACALAAVVSSRVPAAAAAAAAPPLRSNAHKARLGRSHARAGVRPGADTTAGDDARGRPIAELGRGAANGAASVGGRGSSRPGRPTGVPDWRTGGTTLLPPVGDAAHFQREQQDTWDTGPASVLRGGQSAGEPGGLAAAVPVTLAIDYCTAWRNLSGATFSAFIENINHAIEGESCMRLGGTRYRVSPCSLCAGPSLTWVHPPLARTAHGWTFIACFEWGHTRAHATVVHVPSGCAM
jgi:hypothetical protein